MKFLWLFLLLTPPSFISLYVLMKKMNVTNVVGSYFFSNILITNTGIIINLNLKLTKQADPTSQIVFWTQKIPELTLKPALLLWLIYFLLSSRSVASKLIYLIIFTSALVSIEIYFVLIGYLEWVKWNAFYGYLRYGVIIIFLVIYSFYLERLITRNKEVLTR